jgi:hypothetical protein
MSEPEGYSWRRRAWFDEISQHIRCLAPNRADERCRLGYGSRGGRAWIRFEGWVWGLVVAGISSCGPVTWLRVISSASSSCAHGVSRRARLVTQSARARSLAKLRSSIAETAPADEADAPADKAELDRDLDSSSEPKLSASEGSGGGGGGSDGGASDGSDAGALETRASLAVGAPSLAVGAMDRGDMPVASNRACSCAHHS